MGGRGDVMSSFSNVESVRADKLKKKKAIASAYPYNILNQTDSLDG